MKRTGILVLLPCFLGCSFSNSATAAEYYADILPLVEQNCLACHSESSVSFSFEDPERTYSFRAAMTSAVADDRMPPWLAERGHKDYVDDYSLSVAEKAIFAAWADAGHPRNLDEQERHKATMVATAPTFESDFSVELISGRSYLPNQKQKDDYRCFIVDWPFESDKYVTGFKGEPGNLRIAHHLVNYAVGPESADLIRELSAEEEGEGHQCFGGPLPDRMADEGERAKLEERHPGAWEKLREENFWLSHWAPGMTGFEFPENTGVLMKPGSVVVVQMHYYSAFAPGESDQGSAMHFQVADTVEKPSVNFPLTMQAWLGSRKNKTMLIPEGGRSTYQYSRTFDNIRNYAARVLLVEPSDVAAMELRSANVHMHSYGASGNTSLVDGAGRKQMLLNVPRWDLNWQRDFTFVDPIRIDLEDLESTSLVVECTFANHTDEMVYGGFGSDDEMCINFSYVSLVLKKDRAVAAR
jgi:hypothetical protein